MMTLEVHRRISTFSMANKIMNMTIHICTNNKLSYIGAVVMYSIKNMKHNWCLHIMHAQKPFLLMGFYHLHNTFMMLTAIVLWAQINISHNCDRKNP
jgi:hypothetical protein